jgi:hypothetical protein
MLEYLGHFSLKHHRILRRELEQWYGYEAVNFRNKISAWIYAEKLITKHRNRVSFETFHQQLLAGRDQDPEFNNFSCSTAKALQDSLPYCWYGILLELTNNIELGTIYRERL